MSYLVRAATASCSIRSVSDGSGRAAKREVLQLFALAPVRRGEGKG